jgi:hypothetical protein
MLRISGIFGYLLVDLTTVLADTFLLYQILGFVILGKINYVFEVILNQQNTAITYIGYIAFFIH